MHALSSILNTPRKEVLLVLFIAIVIGIGLGVATWDMLFWPTDTEVYYLEAARALPQIKFISQMHTNFDQGYFRFLHGKEFYILSASWVQRLMRDTETLRPFLLICIFSIMLSGVLIFLIARKLWGRVAAWVCYFLFTTCFWPYQQILYTGHLPQGLVLFLLAVAAVVFSVGWRRWVGFVVAGALLGLSFYSSPVSILYFPLFLAAFLWRSWETTPSRKTVVPLIASGIAVGLSGFLAVVIAFNYPDIFANFKKYLEFVDISSSRSHFFYNQPTLIQWIPHPELPVRGGWLWVFKYFRLVMPVLFRVFVMILGFVLWEAWQSKTPSRKRWLYLAMLVLAWSSPLLAEIRGVAQIGRSYFPSLVSILALVGFGVWSFQADYWPGWSRVQKKFFWGLASGIALIHIIVNAAIFFGDVYPARMGITFLAKEIQRRGIREIYTYIRHPYQQYVIDCFPKALKQSIRFINIDSVAQVSQGYILVPPVTGDAIFNPAHGAFNDYDKDLVVNQMFRKKSMAAYAVADFPTLASSRIWPQEEEILAYKNLVLGHTIADPARTRVWLLDASQIKKDLARYVPSPADLFLVQNPVRNIGTQEPVFRFEGRAWVSPEPLSASALPLRVWKVGDPQDGLVAYLYRVAKEEALWVPVDDGFASTAVASRQIPAAPTGETIFKFPFTRPLPPGRYRVVVYRTGKADDQNFYRIFVTR